MAHPHGKVHQQDEASLAAVGGGSGSLARARNSRVELETVARRITISTYSMITNSISGIFFLFVFSHHRSQVEI